MSFTFMNNLRTHNATVREEIDRAIQSVLDSGQYLCGPETEQFEQEYAAFCAMEHCISVANGTDALEISLLARMYLIKNISMSQ